MADTKDYKNLIIGISVILPIAVAALYYGPKIGTAHSLDFLPKFYSSLNGFTAILLIVARVAIKKGNKVWHARLMGTAMICSVIFLLSYVLYHATHESTKFLAEGGIKYVYYFILLSHILLSIAIVPLVLVTYTRALGGKFYKHKKIAKWTFPIWLYVAITGVIIYIMISPYY